MASFFNDLILRVSPSWAVRREANRLRYKQLTKQRGYEAAQRGRRNSLMAITSSSAREVSKGSRVLAAEAQEACRNNPLAKRIKMTWANAIVGKGITPELLISNKQKEKRTRDIIDEWAESTDCDFDGVMTLTGLQWLMAATAVESGGCLIRFHINRQLLDEGKFPLQLQLIEQQYLDRSKNDGDRLVDGIQYNDKGVIEGYWVESEDTGLNITGRAKSVFYRHGSEMVHLYRKERTGQHLGVTWLAEVLTLLDKYNTLQDAVLMQQQIAACLGVIVRESNSALGLSGRGDEELPDELVPGTINYMKGNAELDIINPPKAGDQGQFIYSLKNDIATGVGMTYPQLTGDYSKFNFASGRMGKSDFHENLDQAQYSMMLPILKAISNKMADLLYLMLGSQCKVNWAFPARTMVNPVEDLQYISDRVRSGFLSPSAACRMLGVKLEDVIEQWRKDKTLFGDLPFDIDPSKFSSAGNQLDKNDAASSNQEGGEDDSGNDDADNE